MRLLLSGGDKSVLSVTAGHYRLSIIDEHECLFGNSWQKAAKTSDPKAPPHPFHTHRAHMQLLNTVPLLEMDMARRWLLYLQNERKQSSCQPSHHNSWLLSILINSQL